MKTRQGAATQLALRRAERRADRACERYAKTHSDTALQRMKDARTKALARTPANVSQETDAA